MNTDDMATLKLSKSNFISSKTIPISKEYTLGKTLGSGAFGTVRLAVHKATKQTRAVKVLKKSNQDINLLMREVEILSKLSHPNIMQIFEVFQDQSSFYIVSEYCKGGELFDILSQKGSLSEKDTANIMKQVLSAISYSHKNNIVHRDLKPENILLDDNSKDLFIKIIDWGCAVSFSTDKKMHEADGTAYYIAPEVLREEYDEKCDVWSCGVIMYILLSGELPFFGETEEIITKNILEGKYTFASDKFESVSKEAKDLISKCLEYNKHKRINVKEALDHPFFKTDLDRHNIFQEDLDSKNVLNRLSKFSTHSKFYQAVLAFLAHNYADKTQIDRIKKIFLAIDLNFDGKISKEELLYAYQTNGIKVSKEQLNEIIRSIDSDNNGFLEYEEFIRAAIPKENLFTEVNLRTAFDLFDLDKNGTISPSEVKEVLGMDANVDEKVLIELLKEIQNTGDDEITFEQFKKIMTSFGEKEI